MTGATLRKPRAHPLEAYRARHLMSANPVSLRRDATVREAVALLADRGFGAAPVIDEAGRPVGVVSRTDVLLHEREHARQARPEGEGGPDVPRGRRRHEGFSVEVVDPTTVAEIMTPAVFAVPLNAPARDVVHRMLELKVHQVFVVDEDLALVGVISALDVLRHV